MNTEYKCVTTVDGIKDYIGGSRIVAFDFETAPDDPYREEDKAALDPAKAHIVGCSFSVKEGTGVYVPVAHRVGTNIDQDAFFAFLMAFLMDKTVIKIAHNIAFESSMAYARGIVIQAPVYDTICASQMSLKSIYEFRKLNESGLKRLAEELFGEPLPSFSSVTDGKHFDELDAQDEETVRYGSADSDFALRLYHKFNDWFDRYLPKHRYIVEEIESPTAVYLGIMKTNGIPVNLPLMQERKAEAENEMERIRREIEFIIGDVNIGANCSTQAFKNYLYKDLGLPILKTTETNREAADDMTMTLLKEWCDENRPDLSGLFTLVQEYRKWGKIKSTYIDGYLKYLNPVTGCIHPELFALSTDTGRMNCRNPNAQNMPRKTNDPIGVRNFIKAPEGCLILSLDFSQIELRVGAFYCRDERMLDTYRKNGDIHAATTSVIFGVSYEEAQDKHSDNYKEHRTIAKNVNFGTFYGLFPRGLQKTLKFKAGVEKSVSECEEILFNLKHGYKGLTAWQEETKADAARRMYYETWLGRRRYLPGITSDNWGQKSFVERCALNTPIQGTAADILKLAITRILAGLPEREWLKPILQIHDELTFIIPEDRLKEAVAFIRACMEEKPFPEFDLPLIAEASAGPTFGMMEELED
ncbi:bifunctional 3'-5' exonuclease/DNA polymerase [Phascolarctobacterium faecium]|jgi:DNA polymerase-1|uniref:bifunctional 3'-5' exonuclease/DNA polymerase n=1 Tax=Phascolarctobacterium faecium TaxID=33025 RepID=UPI00205B886E|nr:bifunctional 3'-5' exonuclease/DNA polymerase [Phascolarctobacterium faecium]DAL51592.1 MAG TPA_asm: DNA POLYMERASE [Caudoviricetes sp.]